MKQEVGLFLVCFQASVFLLKLLFYLVIVIADDSPTAKAEIGMQTDPRVRSNLRKEAAFDGNYIMNSSKVEDFIRSSSAPSAQCGKQLVLAKW